MIRFYQIQEAKISFANFIQMKAVQEGDIHLQLDRFSLNKEKCVEILGYCLMPTHVHFIIRQKMGKRISIFMSNLLNSYTRYFNVKYKRKGPLWVGRFKRILVETDEQLCHLTRYLHLNPVSAGLVSKPEDWRYSSYEQYLFPDPEQGPICQLDKVTKIVPENYKKFVEDYVDY